MKRSGFLVCSRLTPAAVCFAAVLAAVLFGGSGCGDLFWGDAFKDPRVPRRSPPGTVKTVYVTPIETARCTVEYEYETERSFRGDGAYVLIASMSESEWKSFQDRIAAKNGGWRNGALTDWSREVAFRLLDNTWAMWRIPEHVLTREAAKELLSRSEIQWCHSLDMGESPRLRILVPSQRRVMCFDRDESPSS